MTIDAQRGTLRNKKFATQARDFSGLRYGKITPTDIDGLIDFGDKAFVIIETKYTGGKMPFGQRLAIERLTDAIEDSKRKGLALIAEFDNNEGDIDFAKAVVVEYRYGRQWKIPRVPLNVRDAIDRFLVWAGVTAPAEVKENA